MEPQSRFDSVGSDVADGVDGLHLVHSILLHLLLLLLLLDICLRGFGTHLVRQEARLRGGLNTVDKVQNSTKGDRSSLF